MEYNAVIFDLEGTLLHTVPECIYQIVGKTFREFGITLSIQEIERFWFDHKREQTIKNILRIDDPEIFWKVWKKHDTPESREKYFRLYNDVGFVKALRRKGLITGIVTGSPVHTINLGLNLLGKNNFNAVIRSHLSNGIKPKPDPHGIQACLKLLGVRSREAIYVGNGDEDILTARAAGVFDVLIDRGEHSLAKETPSLKIRFLYELRDFLGL